MNLFWHRRDLRIKDNVGLSYCCYHALQMNGKANTRLQDFESTSAHASQKGVSIKKMDLKSDNGKRNLAGRKSEAKTKSHSVQPIFIFDPEILDLLKSKSDHRVTLIYDWLSELRKEYQKMGGDLWVFYGRPLEIFKNLTEKYHIQSVFTNHDYEPTARLRDDQVRDFLQTEKIQFQTFKDQVIFEKSEIVTGEGNPYTVYTPYKKKWLSQFRTQELWHDKELLRDVIHRESDQIHWCELVDFGFSRSSIKSPQYCLDRTLLQNYDKTRDFPAEVGTSQVGTALRFGQLSIREMANLANQANQVWLSELIWREFFMQILFHYPQILRKSFRPQYDRVAWRKSPSDFERWKAGETGYPIVDAGMRELRETGYMHNRVRMIVGSFLTKHLLIHWYHGERYFAETLFDYDLAANNGNWQWVAGTGCDAAPYFRIFNPASQTQKFDPEFKYIRKWVPEFETSQYPKPMIDHVVARERALDAFKTALKGKEV